MISKNLYNLLTITVLLLSFSVTSLSGQILTESFDDDSQIIKSHGFFTDGPSDYFGIFDPAGTAHDFDGFPTPPIGVPVYTGNTGFYLVGEDLDGGAYPATQTLSWNNLNISGFADLNISVDVAVDPGGFDATDEIIFAVSIDGGAFVDIINITSPSTSGTATDGTIALSLNLQTITEEIIGTGNLLDLRLTATANGGDEEFAIDEIILVGTPAVICPHTVTAFAPTAGAVGTEVQITGTGFEASNTVDFDGVVASVQFVDATTLIATVPSSISTGGINVTEADCTTTASNDFTFFENSGSCFDVFSDLVMSEVYDQNGGSLGFIELYNGTTAVIDLTDYKIDRYASLTSTTSTHSYTFPTSGVGSIIAVGEVLVGKVSSASASLQDFTFTNTAGYNSQDRLELVKISTGAVIDDLHDDVVEATGFIYRRNTTIPGPNPAYTASEWTTATIGDESGLGTFINNVPMSSIVTEPSDGMGCNIDFEVTATAGNGGTLTYQWFFNENDGAATDWTAVSAAEFPGTVVTGATSNNLSITGGLAAYSGYQFYVVIAEDGLCEVISEAVQFSLVPDRFFRSVQSGNWSDATTWENAASATGPWSAACGFPIADNSDYIHVLTGHTVMVTTNVAVVGEVVVEEGGTIVINDNAELQVND